MRRRHRCGYDLLCAFLLSTPRPNSKKSLALTPWKWGHEIDSYHASSRNNARH
jgi:hypothetical protein